MLEEGVVIEIFLADEGDLRNIISKLIADGLLQVVDLCLRRGGSRSAVHGLAGAVGAHPHHHFDLGIPIAFGFGDLRLGKHRRSDEKE